MATPGELVEQLNRLAETVQLHDGQIKAIVQALTKMMERPPEPKRSIGFHASCGSGTVSGAEEIPPSVRTFGHQRR
jgi:hypothetical protein